MHKGGGRWKKSQGRLRGRDESRGRHRHRSPMHPRGGPMSPPMRNRRRREPSYTRGGGRQQGGGGGGGYTTLLISNIGNKEHPADVKESLEYEFNKYGENNVRVTHDRNGDQIAYATFQSPSDAMRCKSARGVLLLKERKLRIDPVFESSFDESFDDYQQRRSMSPPPMRRSRSPQYRNRKQRGRSGSYDDRRVGNKHSPGRYRDNSRDFTPPPPMRGPPKYRDESRSPSYSPEPQDFFSIDENLHDPHFRQPSSDHEATRTLFVGNLENHVTEQEVRRLFGKYGYIESIDIKENKRPGGSGGSYCFVRYGNLDMAYRAKLSLNGKAIYQNPMHVGYGKIQPTNRVWVGGLGNWTKLGDLEQEFDRFGSIKRIDYHRGDSCAAILYETIDAAKEACSQMRGFLMPNAEVRLSMDFLDPDADEMSYRDVMPNHRRRGGGMRMDGYRGGRGGYRGRGRGGYQGFDRRGGSGGYKGQSPPRGFDSPMYQQHGGGSSKKMVPSLNPARAEMLYKQNQAKNCYTLQELCRCFSPPCWQGGFVLKGIQFPVLFFLLEGDMGIFNTTTADPTSPTGRRVRFNLNHRLSLAESRIDLLRHRLDRPICKERTCVVVAVPGVPEDLLTNPQQKQKLDEIKHKPLRGLVKYFKDRNCAAVVKLPMLTRGGAPALTKSEGDGAAVPEKKLSGVLHAFPPSPFVTEQLLKFGPSLQPQLFANEYMLVYLVKGRSIVV